MRRAAVLAFPAAALLLSGCGAPRSEQDQVTSLARQWLAAVQVRDADAECALLTPAAARSAATGTQTCVQALGQLRVPGAAPIGEIEIWGDSAQVHASGDTLFLTRLSGGWRVNGAGCQRQSERPYDCDLEG